MPSRFGPQYTGPGSTNIGVRELSLVQRIGLLTLPLHFNYGGLIQAAALYHILSSQPDRQVVFLEREWPIPSTASGRALIALLTRLPGLDAVQKMLANGEHEGILSRLLPARISHKLREKVAFSLRAQRRRRHQPFVDQWLPVRSGRLTSSEDAREAAVRLNLDMVVVGSDQVWRLDYAPDDEAKDDFFLGFAPPGVRKISYAASFGHGAWTYPDLTARTETLLADFDAVSVREASGVAISAELGRFDAQHVLDPTMLVDPVFYQLMVAPRSRSAGKTLLSYVLDEEPDRPFIAREVLAALGSDYSVRSLSLDGKAAGLSVPEWLRAFMDADFVVTDSFHGMVFSILLRKDFIAITNRERGADRFTSLLGKLGLMDRLTSDPKAEQLHRLARSSVDFDMVGEQLAELRKQSAAFLRDAIG